MSVYNFNQYNTAYYGTSLAAGSLGTCITHTAMTPFDVIKTKIQLEPTKYPWNPLTTSRLLQQQKIPLFTGGIPTAIGYFGQGAGKFGGVEVIKIQLAKYLGDEKVYENKTSCTLVASAVAETLTDIFWLCPFEAIRIKQVSNPGLGMAASFQKVMTEEGLITGFYSGLIPLLCKQVPYTMAKFGVQDILREKLAPFFGIKNMGEVNQSSYATQIGLAVTSGFGAGAVAAVISHPADTLLTLINKSSAGGDEGLVKKMGNIVRSMGLYRLSTTALFTRILHVGFLTAGQFLVFDVGLATLGFSKFHFINPNEPESEIYLKRRLSTGL